MPVRVTRANEVERALSNVYLRLFSEIKKDENYPDNIPTIIETFNKKVYDSTRKAVESVYQEGTNYVGQKLKVETFLTDTDLKNIREATDAGVKSFWGRINDDAARTIEQRLQEGSLIISPKQSLATTTLLTGISTVLTTSALATGTKSKTQAVVADPELEIKKPRIRWIAMMDEKTCKVLPNGKEGCYYLDGREWEYDDPEIPTPGRLGPDATHPNCRCYLELF